jgi:hypothetical protein
LPDVRYGGGWRGQAQQQQQQDQQELDALTRVD